MPSTEEQTRVVVPGRESVVKDRRPGREIETLDPLRDQRWQPFVEASPSAGIFHHTGWLQLLHDQYRYPMLSPCVLDERGAILAALPFALIKSRLTGTRLVALPFSDLCSPLTGAGCEHEIGALLKSIRAQHERDSVDVEIRAELEGVGHAGTAFYHHTVALGPDLDAVRGGFSSSVRRRVSKAERECLEVVLARDRSALDEFYRLHLITRRRQGVPTQPKRFILRFAQLFERGLGFVLLARADRRTIAAAVFLTFNGVVTYKYGASDPTALKKKPNNAVLMEAIRWGCANGYHTFDLGRTDMNNDGLRAFKRGWGADERVLTYTRLSRVETSSNGEPVPRFASYLINRLPPVGGRIAGELLYRHFG